MNIAIVGTGYVGLVTGACFAEFGYTVTCVDRNEQRIAALQAGEVPIYEPGLDDLVSRNSAKGRLLFTRDLPQAVGSADVVFIAVGTPSRHGDGYADLSFVFDAAREMASSLHKFTVLVDKSTVPVGTARAVARAIREVNPAAGFAIASNPEFLREGSAIDHFMRPDRVVIGVEDERAGALLRELYRPLYLLETPMVVTDLARGSADPVSPRTSSPSSDIPGPGAAGAHRRSGRPGQQRAKVANDHEDPCRPRGIRKRQDQGDERSVAAHQGGHVYRRCLRGVRRSRCRRDLYGVERVPVARPRSSRRDPLGVGVQDCRPSPR
jgi:hypothetical protein